MSPLQSWHKDRSAPAKRVRSRSASESARRSAKLEIQSGFRKLELAKRAAANGLRADAERQLASLIAERGSAELSAREEYGRMLLKDGRYDQAREAVMPLVFPNGWEHDKHSSSGFGGVEIYAEATRKLEGEPGVKAFYNSIRERALDGFSLRYYNERGLTDEQAMKLIKADYAFGQQKLDESYELLRQIIVERPKSELPYQQIHTVLRMRHRDSEFPEILAKWYRSSSPETQEHIRVLYPMVNYMKVGLNRP
jgi:hypothetical protein